MNGEHFIIELLLFGTIHSTNAHISKINVVQLWYIMLQVYELKKKQTFYSIFKKSSFLSQLFDFFFFCVFYLPS